MDWMNNLCNCFSPELRKNIIGYLSASNLNRQVIQQQKCTQQIQQKDEESIYEQVKQRSYYTIHGEQNEHIQKQQEPKADNQLEFQNQLDPCWYPDSKHNSMSYDEIFEHKFKALKHIFQTELDEQYQKVYDSQDDNNLIIYAKNQLQKGKKMNVYRFSFNVPNSDSPSIPKDFMSIQTMTSDGKSHIQSLLKHRQLIQKTQKSLELCYRTYDKKLVISQHDFVTAEKTTLQQQLDEELSSQGKQIYDEVVYTVCFSIKGLREEKSVVFNRGWVNLCGIKAFLQTKQKKNESNQEEISYVKELKVQGYINVELDTTVNANMLKQPAAKQIRIFAQKLICLLQKSDAI